MVWGAFCTVSTSKFPHPKELPAKHTGCFYYQVGGIWYSIPIGQGGQWTRHYFTATSPEGHCLQEYTSVISCTDHTLPCQLWSAEFNGTEISSFIFPLCFMSFQCQHAPLPTYNYLAAMKLLPILKAKVSCVWQYCGTGTLLPHLLLTSNIVCSFGCNKEDIKPLQC